MAYIINAVQRPMPGFDAAANAYATIAENHGLLYEMHVPSIFESSREMVSTSSALDPVARFRVRGNVDRHPIVVRFRADVVGVPKTVRLIVGDVVGSPVAISSSGTYEVTATPSEGGVQDCVIAAVVPGANPLTLSRLRAYLVPSSSGRQRSGWVPDDQLADGDLPIAVEHIERWRNGPVQIAGDRPSCLMSHVTRITPSGASIPGKYWSEWMVTDRTYTSIVGRALVPRADTRPRRYVIDAWVNRFAGSADVTAELQIGGWSWVVPAINAWASVEVELPPGPHDVRAALLPGASTSAKFETVQIWRV